MMAWVSPSLRKVGDEVEIVDQLDGYEADRLLAQSNAEGTPCGLTHADGRSRCPLIEGHIGDHWQAASDLYDQIAPVVVWAELTVA